MIGKVMNNLPDVLPSNEVRVDKEEKTFRKYENGSFEDTYVLDKSPATTVEKVTGRVNGDEYIFTKGTDYVIDTQPSGSGSTETLIVFDTSETIPDAGTLFSVQYTTESVISRYIESHEEEFETLDERIEDVIDSRQVNNASGQELDEIGKLFGLLGERRGRTDPRYRTYLKNILAAFKGRGRVGDITFAVAGGVKVDPANVSLDEDFQDNEYEVIISGQWGPHPTGFVHDLAELTDPSGVDFRDPIVYKSEEQHIFIVPAEAVTDDIDHVSESLAIFVNVSDGQQQTISTVGLSTNFLSQDYIAGSTPSETTDGLGTETLGSGTLG